MSQEKQQRRLLTNMIWRSMAESILFSLFILFVLLYMLSSYGYFNLLPSWTELLNQVGMLLLIVIGLGLIFGYWQSNKIRLRLEQLQQSMFLMEKGNLSQEIPLLGDDEIGMLSDQLSRIREKWEEQITTLQRLSNNNAELAEKARFSAVTEERQRLARELHDSVSQQLFAISMTATAVSRILDKDVEKVRRQISLIEEMSFVAQSEMRALLLHLRPVHLEGKGLTQGLKDLVQELNAKVPIEIGFEMDQHIQINKGIEDHLFRIVQEALSNALRHARAEKIEIKLHERNDTLRLLISDNGEGFDISVKKQSSYGLSLMKERVNEVGGTLQIISAIGSGTRIDVRIPLLTEESGGEKGAAND